MKVEEEEGREGTLSTSFLPGPGLRDLCLILTVTRWVRKPQDLYVQVGHGRTERWVTCCRGSGECGEPRLQCSMGVTQCSSRAEGSAGNSPASVRDGALGRTRDGRGAVVPLFLSFCFLSQRFFSSPLICCFPLNFPQPLWFGN